ncbi:FGGY family carbohydrate kinase [Oryzobacter telluris]|uniref:FGGY family carbohydrate kinase n=1 Tax=Oryzobacter telluris TaxID=3149179 RepID=UPI00370D96BC
MATWVDVGIDCGTTVTKAVAVDDDGTVLTCAVRPTRWDTSGPDRSERDVAALLADVDDVLAEVCASVPGARVRSVGVCSIAESGVLLADDGSVRSRMMAWHDARGAHQAASLDPGLAALFPARTGLSVSPVPTLFKLLWLRDEGGVDLHGLTWLGVADAVVHHLGAPANCERSLAGRTGLRDVHDDGPWSPAFALLGVGTDLLPPVVTAGAAIGSVRADHPVAAARGAVLTLAGLDHLAAAVAVGAEEVGSVCDSIGTAEALTATLAAPPPPDALATLVSHHASAHAHVLDGATCVITGLRTGLVLDHVLTRLGARTREERLALDAAARGVAPEPGVGLAGTSLDADRGVSATWPDGTTPAAAWAGALAVLREGVASRLAAVREAGGSVDHLVVTGGWAHLATVLDSRRDLAARMTVVALDEPGAVGSARFGRWAAEQGDGTDPTRQRGPAPGWFGPPRA